MAKLVPDEGQYSPQPSIDSSLPPYVYEMSPKDRSEWMAKQTQEGQKRINEIRDVTNQGSDVLNRLNEFGGYNESSRTGGINEWLPMPSFMRGDDEQKMQAITADLAPKKRIAGAGTTSDRDLSLYLQSLPSIDKRGGVNAQIIADYQKQYDYALAKQTFLQDYLQKRGHLFGVDQQWAQTPTAIEYTKRQAKKSAISGNGFSAKEVP